jgi:hypothetical protein
MRVSRALVALALFASSPAAADSLQGTRYVAEERADRVRVTLDRGFAKLVVDRVVYNEGLRSDQAIFMLDLPAGAAATRLRTAGVDADGKTTWFEGDLMDAEEAAAKYRELTGLGGYYPKDPALLSWRDRGRLALQVFPVPPKATKTVEYTLVVPMRYEGGKYALDLAPLGTTEVPATVRVRAAHEGDTFLVNGVPLAPETGVVASRDLVIEMRPVGTAPLTAALAAVALGDKRAFVHARVAAAPHLAEVPAHAAVAVVLDMSRSMQRDVSGELAAAGAYLANLPDATVTVVMFDRKVTLPFGANIPARDAITRLAAFDPVLGNGSQVDDAIARADAILSDSGSAVRRMLVLSDLRTRETLTPGYLAALTLRSGAVVHLATIAESRASLERDDESPWAALPRKTGGVLWHAAAVNPDVEARAIFEEWARPKRIDHVTLEGFPEGFYAPEVLDEGQGVEYLGVGEARPREIALAGEVWSTKTRIAAASTSDEERLWSALVFGSPESDGLTEDEQRVLAMKGGAVSPVTSYLAIEPGVRPSTEGLLDSEGFGEGCGGIGSGIGLGSIGTIGHGGGSSFDPQRFLETELGRAFRTCGGKGRAEVKLESTLDEVVAVGSPGLAVPRADTAACLTEAVWALTLPSGFVAEHETWTVGVEG